MVGYELSVMLISDYGLLEIGKRVRLTRENYQSCGLVIESSHIILHWDALTYWTEILRVKGLYLT